MIKRLFHILGVSNVIIAVCCLLIGVIVEFHQVHIYKSNISFWELQATKTVNDNSKKYVQPIAQLIKQLHSGLPNNEIGHCLDLVHFRLSENTIYSRHLFDLTTHEYRSENILRGPPCL